MTPIHELLNRIRWDPQFGAGEFVIGYYDRSSGEVRRAPFASLGFPPDEHFRFTLIDEEGAVHAIPYHRVREVYRNGELIWRREG